MEIIHVILGKANPDRMNGVNKVVYQMATQQALAGKPVAVWGITKDTSPNYGERAFETRLFQAHRNPLSVDGELEKAMLAKKGQAVFHFHGGWIPIYASLSGLLAKNTIPFVLTPHGAYNSIARKRSRWVKQVYFQLFERKMLQSAAKIHAIGESEVEGLHQIYPNQKAFLCPYGFEANGVGASIESLASNEFIIGFVGRLDIYTKGLDLILKAFKGFVSACPHARLWIVGDGPQRPALEKMIHEMALDGQVTLWGSKFGQEKDELIAQMTIFLHPSRNEGMPASVLEAANFGVPCVVSKATNIGKHIEKYHAGICIDNESSEQLELAVDHLHGAWKLDRLLPYQVGAKQMVAGGFDWAVIVNELDKLYQ